MLRTLRWITAALIVVYLVFTPRLIQRGLARDQYSDWLEPEKPAWRGQITLWHIAGFRVYQGSVTHYLEERADAYCKAHAGVHIEVVGLTNEQYAERIARGAVPDGYSFPSGLLYAEQLKSTDYATPALCGTLHTAAAGGRVYAVPYLMSGSFLCANTQLLAHFRTDLPESPDAAFLQSALTLDASEPQLFISEVPAALLELDGTPADSAAFLGGHAMLGVLDARALGDYHRGGSTLNLEAVAFPLWSDQVQYIGAARGTDDVRAAIIADFAAFLLTAAEQERLSSIGALPVTAEAKPVFAERCLTELFEQRDAIRTPDPFSYQRHRDALTADAAAALLGDAAAKKSFFERMKVVESGEL